MNDSALPEVAGHEFMILADANGITRIADNLGLEYTATSV